MEQCKEVIFFFTIGNGSLLGCLCHKQREMREIKFRAWAGAKMHYMDGQDKEWLLITASGYQAIQSDVVFDEVGKGCEANNVEFDDWRLMQFTGLKDKNGVEIYEGDVVKTIWRPQKTHTVGIVIWLDERCKYVLSNMDGSIQSSFPVKNIRNTEVIGNIYEDPDLLLNKET